MRTWDGCDIVLIYVIVKLKNNDLANFMLALELPRQCRDLGHALLESAPINVAEVDAIPVYRASAEVEGDLGRVSEKVSFLGIHNSSTISTTVVAKMPAMVQSDGLCF